MADSVSDTIIAGLRATLGYGVNSRSMANLRKEYEGMYVSPVGTYTDMVITRYGTGVDVNGKSAPNRNVPLPESTV